MNRSTLAGLAIACAVTIGSNAAPSFAQQAGAPPQPGMSQPQPGNETPPGELGPEEPGPGGPGFMGGRGGRRAVAIPGVNLKLGPARMNGRKVMNRLAAETGGAYFDVDPNHTIEAIYSEIEELLRNQYSIGYTPKTPGKSGEYRKIKLTAKRKDLVVQTRDGYYAK